MWSKSDSAFEDAYCWGRCCHCDEASSTKTLFLSHRPGLALSPVLARAGHARSRARSPDPASTETGPFSADSASVTVPGESYKAGCSVAAFKTHPGVPSCGEEPAGAAAGAACPCPGGSAPGASRCSPAPSEPLTRGSSSSSGSLSLTSPWFTCRVCADRFTTSVFYKLGWAQMWGELTCPKSNEKAVVYRTYLLAKPWYRTSSFQSLQNPSEGINMSDWGLITRCLKAFLIKIAL